MYICTQHIISLNNYNNSQAKQVELSAAKIFIPGGQHTKSPGISKQISDGPQGSPAQLTTNDCGWKVIIIVRLQL